MPIQAVSNHPLTFIGVGRLRGINPGRAASLLSFLEAGFRESAPSGVQYKTEIAFTSDRFEEIVEATQKANIEAIAGTVISEERVETASKLGIKYIVAPDLNKYVGIAAKEHKIKWIPGILNNNEFGDLAAIVRTSKLSFPEVVKLFPFRCDQSAFGLLKALKGPFQDEIEEAARDERKIVAHLTPEFDSLPDGDFREACLACTPTQFSDTLYESTDPIIVLSPHGGKGLLSFQEVNLDNRFLEGKSTLGAFGGVTLDGTQELIKGGVRVIGLGSDFLSKEVVQAASEGDLEPANAKLKALIASVRAAYQ